MQVAELTKEWASKWKDIQQIIEVTYVRYCEVTLHVHCIYVHYTPPRHTTWLCTVRGLRWWCSLSSLTWWALTLTSSALALSSTTSRFPVLLPSQTYSSLHAWPSQTYSSLHAWPSQWSVSVCRVTALLWAPSTPALQQTLVGHPLCVPHPLGQLTPFSAVVSGLDIAEHHCQLVVQRGRMLLQPRDGACYINRCRVTSPSRLRQGALFTPC